MSFARGAFVRVLVAVVALLSAATVCAQDLSPPGTATLRSRHAFDTLVARVEAAVQAHKMGLVAQASDSRGAAGRDVKIAGNPIFERIARDAAGP